jgi:hypothetical protein
MQNPPPSIIIHTPENKQLLYLSGTNKIPPLSSCCLKSAAFHCFANLQISSIPLLNNCDFSNCLVSYYTQDESVIDLSSIISSRNDLVVLRYFIHELAKLEFASQLEFSVNKPKQDSAINIDLDNSEEHILSLPITSDLISFLKESNGTRSNFLTNSHTIIHQDL